MSKRTFRLILAGWLLVEIAASFPRTRTPTYIVHQLYEVSAALFRFHSYCSSVRVCSIFCYLSGRCSSCFSFGEVLGWSSFCSSLHLLSLSRSSRFMSSGLEPSIDPPSVGPSWFYSGLDLFWPTPGILCAKIHLTNHCSQWLHCVS